MKSRWVGGAAEGRVLSFVAGGYKITFSRRILWRKVPHIGKVGRFVIVGVMSDGFRGERSASDSVNQSIGARGAGLGVKFDAR